MVRTKVIAGNWKMNTTKDTAERLAQRIVTLSQKSALKMILAPPHCFLPIVGSIVEDLSHIELAAQNVHHESFGAYTGEVSVPMLRSLGVGYVILGHSERRQYFGETDEYILRKMGKVLEQGLKVIYCCGENLEDRKAGRQNDIINRQLTQSVLKLPQDQIKNVIVAYEPVWAIGTGETASPQQAQAMHQYIRKCLAQSFGIETAQSCTILYGGSVKPNNALELFQKEDIDGALVGGASLDAEDFVAIVGAMHRVLTS